MLSYVRSSKINTKTIRLYTHVIAGLVQLAIIAAQGLDKLPHTPLCSSYSYVCINISNVGFNI